MSDAPLRGGPGYDQPLPYAFDPLQEPEYFRGVLGRRMVAFLIDAVVICAPVGAAAVFIFLFGFVTLGLGWFLFGLLSPGFFIWAIVYSGLTLGGPRSATLGMRAMEIEMRQWDGTPMTSLLAVLSVVLFWVFMSVLTPLVLIVPLLNPRRRLLHDLVLGTVVTNNDERAGALRGWRG
ncbi:RDD family protein [Ancylobacter radicis]|uniref:RDD family protein n=1 Tax=Ancylobacter radicis TaxID=2836179 RepID=A0ABS5R6Q5_9HYPH|nr:RDD family protein [Ancylobacter radicis]MBS9476489.1 RDD family protein [Ancylobacter radicis]